MFLQPIGKVLIVVGLILIGLGALFLIGPKLPYVGRLPGDIYIQRKNFTLYFPLTTSVLLSLLLSAILYFLSRR